MGHCSLLSIPDSALSPLLGGGSLVWDPGPAPDGVAAVYSAIIWSARRFWTIKFIFVFRPKRYL